MLQIGKRAASAVGLALALAALPSGRAPQTQELPRYLRDRGTGVSTSMFGTYIQKGELMVYPFFEYSLDNNREYQPAKLGFGLKEDFRGKYRDSREQLFIAYGLTDRLALEFEAAVVKATLEKSPGDPSATPAKISQSGFGDLEGQLRALLLKESDHRPELFGFLEVTAPLQKNKVLIGDRNWDFKPGVGIARGFSWGTMTFRTTMEYNRDNTHFDLGETSLEYLRHLSSAWRVYFGIEGGETGAPDEWDLRTGASWRITDFAFLKFDNTIGISSKATDWAPHIGLLFSPRLH